MSQLQAADPLRDGAGEGTLLVTEKFALQQAKRYGRAVQSNEGPVPPRANGMNRPGNQFLTGSGLTQD